MSFKKKMVCYCADSCGHNLTISRDSLQISAATNTTPETLRSVAMTSEGLSGVRLAFT